MQNLDITSMPVGSVWSCGTPVPGRSSHFTGARRGDMGSESLDERVDALICACLVWNFLKVGFPVHTAAACNQFAQYKQLILLKALDFKRALRRREV